MLPRRALATSVAVVALLLLGSLLVVPAASGTTASTTLGSSGSEFAAAPDAAVVYSGSFAVRAGFESAYLSEAHDIGSATGSDLVVVTFYPSSPAFFVPPATGAAPLSVSMIASEYGLAPVTYAAAESYFESMGLTVVHANPDRLSVTLQGPVAAMGRAFGTSLESGTYNGRSVMFASQPPTLPATIEPLVSSVVGLENGFDTFTLPNGVPSMAPASVAQPSAQPDLITPAIARLIYDVSPLYNVSGTFHSAVGEGIALLLWGWGYSPADLSTFFGNDYPSGFPQPGLHAYPIDGAPAPSANAVNDPSKAPQELTLDIEWSGSMAPGATLDAIYAPDGPASDNYSPSDGSMADALNEAVTGISGVSAISMSFGTPENASAGLQSAWATDFATAAQEGITLLAATGDFGGDAEANCQGGPSMDYPASSPDVIAVGGTQPVLARNVLGQVTGLAGESAWSGSSGGFSADFAAPSWEKVGSAGAVIAANGDRRGTPDVSASAALNYLYYNSQSGVAAGTSFASPLWAGLVVEMDSLYGSRLGFFTPRLYTVGASEETGKDLTGLADVVGGSTCIGTATQGWDPETGWGSPRALALYEDLTATFIGLTLSASPSPVAPGGTVTIVAYLSNRTSGAPLAGVPVTVSFAAAADEGPCAGVWGQQNLTSNASGAVTLSVAVPTCYFGAHGNAQAVVTSDGYYGSVSTGVDINLLGLVPALASLEQFPTNVVAFAAIMIVAIVIGYVLGRGRAPRGSAAPRPPASAPPTAPPQSPPPARPAAPSSGGTSLPPPAPPPAQPPQ